MSSRNGASVLEESALALDAYSRTVIAVAEAMSGSVANLQVRRRTRRGQAMGAGSGVAISADGFLITSAHVVEGSEHGEASFSDGVGLKPSTEPRPVVKAIRFAPPATMPVTETGS